MEHHEHRQTAIDFLAASDKEFAAGDVLQGSEKIWGAASHALMAVTMQRDWPNDSHRAMSNAVQNLARETGDDRLTLQYAVAEKFHRNFYRNQLLDYEMDRDRPFVHDFVHRVLALLDYDAG